MAIKLSSMHILALASIGGLVGIGLYFLLALHPSQKRSIRQLTRQEASLYAERARGQGKLEGQREALRALVAQNPAVHYVPQPGQPPEHLPWVMERIARTAEAYRVDLLSLGPRTTKPSRHFVEVTTPIQLSGPYPQLVQVVKDLEQNLGLRLAQLSLRGAAGSGPDGPRRHLSFVLTTYEISAHGSSSLPPWHPSVAELPPPDVSAGLAPSLHDPFRPIREATTVVYSEANGTRVEPVYRLAGILNLGGKFRAIVNDKLVKEGDHLEGNRVIAITRDSVTFLHQGRPLKVRFKPILLGGEP